MSSGLDDTTTENPCIPEANADMDGIAVAVTSESGPTAATCTLTNTLDIRCYSEPLFACVPWVSARVKD